MNLFESYGKLRYSIEPRVGHKLILLIDPAISEFYFSLIPRYLHVRRQAFHPHISVIRRERPPNLEHWNKYKNEIIRFQYENWIYNGTVYYWLNVYCGRLEEIRRELGLPICSPITRSEDGRHRFHSTIGNVKSL